MLINNGCNYGAIFLTCNPYINSSNSLIGTSTASVQIKYLGITVRIILAPILSEMTHSA